MTQAVYPKTCSKCGETKTSADFYSLGRRGLHSWCKVCSSAERERRRKAKRRGEPTAFPVSGLGILRYCRLCDLFKHKRDFYTHAGWSGGFQTYCRECCKTRSKATYRENRAAILEAERRQRWKFRLEMIAAYGGKCVCCGETHPEFLTIDHVGGGGNKDRKDAGGTKAVMKRLRRDGFPKKGYRLLCYNCNCSIGAVGYCPHQTRKLE